jgi:hypothetical protein
VTAWCEIVAMVSSFGVSILFLILVKSGYAIGTAEQLLLTVIVTTVCWLATAYLGPKNDPQVLIDFYRKVRPFGPGWKQVRAKAGISAAETAADARTANFSLSLLGWFCGSIMIWSALFAVGNFLYGRLGYALGLTAIFVVTAAVVIHVVKRIWK